MVVVTCDEYGPFTKDNVLWANTYASLLNSLLESGQTVESITSNAGTILIDETGYTIVP